ncbi:MAG: glycosyl hydrolase [Bacteroidota bacterium]
MKLHYLILCLSLLPLGIQAQSNGSTATDAATYFEALKWRNIGPFRGGRSVAACGVIGDPATYYMGTTGGGLWKTIDAGQRWQNISDGFFKTGSVGAVAVADSDPSTVYVGMGEHAPRGVMTTYGDGVYKSLDAGKTWQHLGLELTRHIANVRIHPTNPDIVYVAAQGALHGPSAERGVYKSTDGGQNWEKVLYVNEDTGCAHLIMDPSNPRILYAAMWGHRRLPWQVISGGPGSGIYKSVDSGKTWTRLEKGLPQELGKMSLAVSAANSEKIYALIESDSEKEQGGLFVSGNAGASWSRISKDHRLVQRAWYYTEVFADPQNENTVYVLNSPVLKSTDGGKSWQRMGRTHSDQHDLWINPHNSNNMVVANDGGAGISFDGGAHWSSQDNMPTGQFYRLNVDNHVPYRIYAGQQDNSSVRIASRNLSGGGITERDWTYSAGGESAFLAFDPDNPRYVLGGSYQGTLEALDSETGEGRRIMASPEQYLAREAKDMRYRFNWNAPVIWSQHEPNTFYHAAQVLLKTQDMGKSWTEVSPDLTRNEREKQGKGGAPYTNEGAGGENYGTISYVMESPHEAGVIWTGSDDGLVHLTKNNGESWSNVTPKGLEECLINAIEVSPHEPGTAYLATTRYKFNDFSPGFYKTTNYGQSWTKINQGIPEGAYSRVVREDPVRKDLLVAGTELGIYLSFDGGSNWEPFQLNLPNTPVTDLLLKHDDIIVATQGRAFWILDDLELVRQYEGPKNALHLYEPQDAIRISAGSPMNGDISNFTGMSGSGVNPASGMVIYYELPADVAGKTLELQIMDGYGGIHRVFSSQADTTFVSYAGGPSSEPVLSCKPGLNRFVWNLRYRTLTGVPKAYIEGSFRGARFTPTTSAPLAINLKLGEEEKYYYGASILSHPKMEFTYEEYDEQARFIASVSNRINTMHENVNQLQGVLTQLNRAKGQLREYHKEERAACNVLAQKIQAWDAQIVQRKSQAYDDVINFPNGLSAEYFFLKGQADSQIPNITEPMRERLEELDALWEPIQKEFQQMWDEDIPTLEKQLRDAGVGILR